jgi:hypothetical protein
LHLLFSGRQGAKYQDQKRRNDLGERAGNARFAAARVAPDCLIVGALTRSLLLMPHLVRTAEECDISLVYYH